ncbi:hypothetical protein GJ496_003309 [Pomphorhynchus laevis]|nr:hypothetical protein GJ496_003309 [Pomphorhynchus laevis]
MNNDDDFHEEINIFDMHYDEESDIFIYPCPCGDVFEISTAELKSGQNYAICPSCSLKIKLLFDKDSLESMITQLSTMANTTEII